MVMILIAVNHVLMNIHGACVHLRYHNHLSRIFPSLVSRFFDDSQQLKDGAVIPNVLQLTCL